MKLHIVSAADLGSHCWSPVRFANSCLPCTRYGTCTYPERQYHIAYHQNRQERAALALRVADLDIAAKQLGE